jgi:hypothetical protein
MRPAVHLIYVLVMLVLVLNACKQKEKIYSSDCNYGHSFTTVSLKTLADNGDFYDHKIVEVSGKFVQEKTMTVLTGDKRGAIIMVEFSNSCPLFLTGTRIGFFDYDNNNGQLTPTNNKLVKVRGEVVLHNKPNLNQLRVALAHVSYVQF